MRFKYILTKSLKFWDLSPKTFRFTREEIGLLVKLTQSLQDQTNKNLTDSKIIRGLVWFATSKPKIWKEGRN